MEDDSKKSEKKDKKPEAGLIIEMTVVDHDGHTDHEIEIKATGTDEAIEHMMFHVLNDSESKLSGVVRNILKKGIVMTMEDAKALLQNRVPITKASFMEDKKTVN